MVRLSEETRKRIERHIQAYPELSNRALGKAVGVTRTSIGRHRRRLNLPQVPGPRMPEVERLTWPSRGSTLGLMCPHSWIHVTHGSGRGEHGH